MRTTIVVLLTLFGIAPWAAAGYDTRLPEHIVIRKVQGDVSVRHGVTEVWAHVAVGDVLRPDDTIKTGKKGSAVIVAQVPDKEKTVTKKVGLPPEVIIDMSDIRDLTPEELMLKLTMEKVRSSSYQWKNDDLHIPNAAVVHGADRSPSAPLAENELLVGLQEFRGAKVLFDNGFYPTCALKGIELFRLYPPLREDFENRMMVAGALEKAHLRGEALNELGELLRLKGITPAQQLAVRAKIEELRKDD